MKNFGQLTLLCSLAFAAMLTSCGGAGNVIEVENGELSVALDQAREMLAENANQKITILLEPGNYTYQQTIMLDEAFVAAENAPLEIKVKGGGKAIFNGATKVALTGSQVVEDKVEVARLGQGSQGNVYRVEIPAGQHDAMLADGAVRLSLNGRMMMISTYPNVGFGHIGKISDNGAIYAHGRTLGDPPTYSYEKPIGGEFTLLGKDVAKWEEEFKSVKKAVLSGYLSHDWYRESHKIASIKNSNIKLMEYSRYGIIDIQHMPRRLQVTNLMCELDSPGEFYYDEAAKVLYFWPFEKLAQGDELSIWSGKSFIKANGASNIKVENLIIEGVDKGGAAVELVDCKNIEFAGCTIRNCNTTAFVVNGGENCGIRSSDIYDVASHISLSGGDTYELVSSKHYAINCHFTQTQYSFYGGIALVGVGQIFSNNLIHNAVGQIMTTSGNDHLVELNEFFNIGIEEGDGGTIYSGSQMWSWGNVLKNNFLHHLMCVPQAHPRGGIYPDDKDQGDNIIGNVFYKAAHRAILINGGAGHTVKSNIFLNGYIGIYDTETGAQGGYDEIAKYESGEMKRGDKGDIIWRTEQAIGKEGWNSEVWKSRYPKFAKIMNQEKRRFWPIELDVTDNCFYGNSQNTLFKQRVEDGSIADKSFEEVDYITTANNRDISIEIFSNPDILDFSYKSSKEAKDMPDVNFAKIGLYTDEYRASTPSKDDYRGKVTNHFKDSKSYDENAKYDVATINDILYFNTGSLILNGGN